MLLPAEREIVFYQASLSSGETRVGKVVFLR
jgi:hypothetical protein